MGDGRQRRYHHHRLDARLRNLGSIHVVVRLGPLAAHEANVITTRVGSDFRRYHGGSGGADARGKRLLGSPDPAGAVECMRVARKAQAAQFVANETIILRGEKLLRFVALRPRAREACASSRICGVDQCCSGSASWHGHQWLPARGAGGRPFGSHQGPTVRKICGTFADSRTLLREAELKLVNRDEFLDAMVVLEEGMAPFRKGASMDELRAEMQRHLEILAPVLDLEALVAPSDGIANREVPQDGAAGDAGEYADAASMRSRMLGPASRTLETPRSRPWS